MNDWHPNTGRLPNTADKQLRVRWREGTESKWTYTAKQLDWRDRGDPMDVTHWKEEN